MAHNQEAFTTSGLEATWVVKMHMPTWISKRGRQEKPRSHWVFAVQVQVKYFI